MTTTHRESASIYQGLSSPEAMWLVHTRHWSAWSVTQAPAAQRSQLSAHSTRESLPEEPASAALDLLGAVSSSCGRCASGYTAMKIGTGRCPDPIGRHQASRRPPRQGMCRPGRGAEDLDNGIGSLSAGSLVAHSWSVRREIGGWRD
jgi:hypothetical protein